MRGNSTLGIYLHLQSQRKLECDNRMRTERAILWFWLDCDSYFIGGDIIARLRILNWTHETGHSTRCSLHSSRGVARTQNNDLNWRRRTSNYSERGEQTRGRDNHSECNPNWKWTNKHSYIFSPFYPIPIGMLTDHLLPADWSRR